MSSDEVGYVIFVLLIIITAAGLVGLGLGLLIAAHGQELESYEDCVDQGLPPSICIAMFPPQVLQGVNWTDIPWP